MMSFLRRIPIAISAVALGAAGLGNLLASHSPVLRFACGALSLAIVALVLLRVAFDFSAVRDELRDPAALAVAPTFTMALMVLSTYLVPGIPVAARALWAGALALQLFIVGAFASVALRPFDVGRVLPTWFLVFTGFVIGSVTAPAAGFVPVGRVLLVGGVIGYLVILPLAAMRIIRRGPLPAPARPTIAIFLAAPSLCLAGYLAVISEKSPVIVYAFLGIAALSGIYLLANLPAILSGPFLPTWASLTFPFVIFATAVKQSHAFLSAAPAGSFLSPVAILVFEVVAASAVLYVAARYALHLAIVPRPVAEESRAAA